MISLLIIYKAHSNLRSKSQAFLPPNSFTNFWRCQGLFWKLVWTAPLSAIKINDSKGPLKPRMLWSTFYSIIGLFKFFIDELDWIILDMKSVKCISSAGHTSTVLKLCTHCFHVPRPCK